MKSLEVYKKENEAIHRKVVDRNRRWANKLVLKYLESMGGANNGHEVTEPEKELIRGIAAALGGVAP